MAPARSDSRDNRRGGRNSSRGAEEATEPRNNERPERSNRNERNAEKAPREESTVASGERQERRPRGERKERQRQQPEAVENKLMPEVSNVGIVANDNAPINARETQEAVNGEEQGARRRGRRGGRVAVDVPNLAGDGGLGRVNDLITGSQKRNTRPRHYLHFHDA